MISAWYQHGISLVSAWYQHVICDTFNSTNGPTDYVLILLPCQCPLHMPHTGTFAVLGLGLARPGDCCDTLVERGTLLRMRLTSAMLALMKTQ
jgi:hypothetical protein